MSPLPQGCAATARLVAVLVVTRRRVSRARARGFPPARTGTPQIRGSAGHTVPALPADALPYATLVWDGTELPGCERSADLRHNVSVYLERDAFEDGAPLTIRITPRRAGTGEVVAEVRQLDGEGHSLGVRNVSGGATCEGLDEPLTLVVALMLDAPPSQPPEAAPSEREVSPAPPVSKHAEHIESPSSEQEDSGPIWLFPEHEATEAAPGHALVSLGLGTTLGQLPFLSYGPEVQVVLKPQHFWGLELSGAVLGGSSVELPISGEIGFRLIQAGGALCPLERIRDGLLLRGCGGMQVGWLRAESRGLEPSRVRHEVVFSPELHLQAAQGVGRGFFLGGGFGVLFPLRANQYTYRDPEGVRAVAFQMASPSLGLGLFVARELP